MITDQVTGRQVVDLTSIDTIPSQVTPHVQTPEGMAQWAEAMLSGQLQPCLECNEIGHFVLVRVKPRPDPARPDAIDKLVEACTCCVFGPIGHPTRGLLFRLRGEQAEDDDLELTVEVLNADGRWIG